MNKSIVQFVGLSWPFFAAGALLSLHFWANQIADLKPVLTIETILGDCALPIPTVCAVRIAISFLALFFLGYPAFRDYSSVFPQRLKMEVFFDDEGISKTIREFTNEDLGSYPISNDWRAKKDQYFEEIELKLRSRAKGIPAPKQFRFRDPTAHVFSQGSTSFVVHKTDGFQKYRIVEAEGNLEHRSEKEGAESYVFSSQFELLITPSNSIEPCLYKIYMPKGWTYVLTPSFKQIFRNNKGKQCWDHTLVAATKVRYFPVTSIGQTLYLYRPDPLSPYVPIGYAIYGDA